MHNIIRRLEQARGPSRDLDKAIADALGLAERRFTASLDDAATLIPAGWLGEVSVGHPTGYCVLRDRDDEDESDTQEIRPATVWAEDVANGAIAICIAALKARSAQKRVDVVTFPNATRR